jgi:type IV pilus assembly protein PilB
MATHRTAPAAALLGALLVAAGAITQEQLDEALLIQAEAGKRLGEVLVQQGWLTERALAEALAEQFGLDFLDLGVARIDENAARSIPGDVAGRHLAIPVGIDHSGRLVVAIADPADAAGITSVRDAAGQPVALVVAEKGLLEERVRAIFG